MAKYQMFKYTFTLQHDAGVHVLITVARNIETAVKTVLDQELAPERAIISIHIEEYNEPS
jgi:hypothetical protein